VALVTVTIDGQTVQAPAGTSVLDAAQSIGIKIPAMCYDPDLSAVGACRLCVVEIEGIRNLPASCVTTCSEGMVVRTGTPAVMEARKTLLELLIANHPLDCMTCEKSGTCLLQQYCYEYGVPSAPFEGDQHAYPIDDDNPFYLRDMNKCIVCGRCIRACEEIVGRNVLDFAYRGFNTKVGPFMDTPISESDCVYCGSCIAVCPVGALEEKKMVGVGRTWELEKVRTTCPYCGTGCTFDLNVKNGKVVGVTGTDGDVNGRFLCVKGRFGYEFIHSDDRLKTPLIKKNGEFKEATWTEAFDLIASQFREIKDKHGSDSFGVLSSARCTNEENYLMSKFTRAVLGTNNIDHCARL
jgi:predicted molibdopterin-dependent oxidoreductase YjgC